jgi:hypothetical protein
MLRWIFAGLALTGAGGAAALLLTAAPGGVTAAGAEDAAPRLEFVRRPLSEVAQAVAARAGQPIAVRSEALGRLEVTVALAGGDPAALLRGFAEALDAFNVALLRDADPGRGWTLIAFQRVAASPATEDEPFRVRVVEGCVRLESGGRLSDVRAGEEGGVAADGRLMAVRRIDPRTVALWRTGAAPAVAEVRPAVPPTTGFAYRVVGTTEDGRTIVEWGAPGEPPQRVLLEKGAREFRVPLPDSP